MSEYISKRTCAELQRQQWREQLKGHFISRQQSRETPANSENKEKQNNGGK